jgi:hypothetical protein
VTSARGLLQEWWWPSVANVAFVLLVEVSTLAELMVVTLHPSF